MGQSLLVGAAKRPGARRPAAKAGATERISIFATPLGWFGLRGALERVSALTIGHGSPDRVRLAAGLGESGTLLPEDDWFPGLRRSLEAFARGIPTDFTHVQLDQPDLTPFRRRVLDVTRQIGYAETATYRDLAIRSGNPRAARAVGAVMASNSVPIIIPCHRVVACGGSLGGFSAPQGIELKRRMLAMEAAATSR